jgi:DNA mismatch endonuclease (patch repair protein)
VAVFVDGCFWHGHPDFFTPGKSGEYWDAKIERTKERDRIANETLRDDGWFVLRFWDFEVEGDTDRCVREVITALSEARATRLHLAAVRPQGSRTGLSEVTDGMPAT